MIRAINWYDKDFLMFCSFFEVNTLPKRKSWNLCREDLLIELILQTPISPGFLASLILQPCMHSLTYEEWRKLKNDCKRSHPKTGLLVAYKTKVDLYIKAGYHPGSWLEYYKSHGEIIRKIG